MRRAFFACLGFAVLLFWATLLLLVLFFLTHEARFETAGLVSFTLCIGFGFTTILLLRWAPE